MKSMIRVLTLFLALAFVLTACGVPFVDNLFPSETSTPAPAEQTPASFGAAEPVQPEQTPETVAETTEAPASVVEPAEPIDPEASAVEPEGSAVEPEGSAVEPEGSAVEPEPIEPPEVSLDPDADMTEFVVKSALCADYINDLWYDPEGPFFWRAMGYLIYLAGPYADGETGSDEDGPYVRVSAESLEVFEKALFGDYFEEDGKTYPDLGEETDIVKWESTPEGEFYTVHEADLDLDDYSVKYEETDWAEHYNATLMVDGTPRAVYELTLEEGESGSLFPLYIAEMAYAGKP